MNMTTILGLLEKGLTALPILVEAGVGIAGLASRLAAVAEAAKSGKTIDQSEVQALEADLDAALAEFNSDLPPEDAA